MNLPIKSLTNYLKIIKTKSKDGIAHIESKILEELFAILAVPSSLLDDFIFDGSVNFLHVIDHENVTQNQLVKIAKIVISSKKYDRVNDSYCDRHISVKRIMRKLANKSRMTAVRDIIHSKEFKDVVNSKTGDVDYLVEICRSEYIRKADIEYLADLDSRLHPYLLENDKLTSKSISHIAKLDDSLHGQIVKHGNTNAKTLKYIATLDKAERYRVSLRCHKNSCSDTLELLFNNHISRDTKLRDYNVLRKFASHHRTPRWILEILSNSKSIDVREAVLGNPSIPIELLHKKFKSTKSASAIVEILKNPSTPIEILEDTIKHNRQNYAPWRKELAQFWTAAIFNPNLTSDLIDCIIKNLVDQPFANSLVTSSHKRRNWICSGWFSFTSVIRLIEHPQITKESYDKFFDTILETPVPYPDRYDKRAARNWGDNLASLINNKFNTSEMIDTILATLGDNESVMTVREYLPVSSLVDNDRLSTAAIVHLDSINPDSCNVLEKFKDHPSIKGPDSQRRLMEIQGMINVGLSALGRYDVDLNELNLEEL